MLIRLNKYLAQLGVASRRKADELIASGRIKVNGQVINQLGEKINPQHDQVSLDGQILTPSIKLIYIMLNKPPGVVSTTSDEFKRQTVLDLVKVQTRLFPVGRLDQDSTGLILLTNDGELTQRLTHPKFEINKTYQVAVQGIISPDQIKRLEEGVLLKEGKTSPSRVEVLKTEGNRTYLEITIHEGRNRQIRRMCGSLDLEVINLKRVSMGPLTLGNLPEGSWRVLTQSEIDQLKMLGRGSQQS